MQKRISSSVKLDRVIMKEVLLTFTLLLAVVLVDSQGFKTLNRPRTPATKKPGDWQPECGIRRVSTRALIVGGRATVPGEWPWHTAVYHVGDGGRVRDYKCGGTLINGNIVLTTASCARHGVNKSEGAIIVELGQYNLKESFAHKLVVPVSHAIVHEQYVPGENKNDLGILQLKTSVNFTDYIQPACLPKESEKIEQYDEQVGSIVGWGFEKAGTLSDRLQSARVPVIPVIDCLQSDVDFFAYEIYPGMYCAGLRNGTAPCFGDAGGGMFTSAGRTWTLRGIISFTSRVYTVTGGCNTEQYFGLVNVVHFLPWIEDTIAGLVRQRKP